MVDIVSGSLTVAQYCEGLENNGIEVDRRYQRSDKVWPLAAQSFLIESILLGFPVPKLFLHQRTDRVSRKTVNFIVDGQQRTVAIRAFYDDELRLARNLEFEEVKDKTYSELDPEFQERFLTYGLSVDYFVNTTEDEVREVFRRINSYEVPLNAEEQRHARWQGKFKWYIYHLSNHLDDVFLDLETFSDKQLVRMQDMKLLAEVSHALLNGITTTNKTSLDKLYKEHDREFAQEGDFTERIQDAVGFAANLSVVTDSVLSKPYAMYALVLAIIHAKRRAQKLQPLATGGRGLLSRATCERRLSALIEVVENEDEDDETFGAFYLATEKGTNVRDARETRFKYFLAAVQRGSNEYFADR